MIHNAGRWLMAAVIIVPATAGTSQRVSGFPSQDALDAARVIGGSVYLGQAYPSGRVYLEAFRDADHQPLGAAAERVELVPLDRDVAMARTGGWRAGARLVGQAEPVNPPAAEGMLPTDSSCVPEGYVRMSGAVYARVRRADDQNVPWRTEDYFSTAAWYGCAWEVSLSLYRAEEPIPKSFRVIGFRAGFSPGDLDHSVAGQPRPMSPEEASELEELQGSEAECTLQPRYMDEAIQLVAFHPPDFPYRVRLSSYVSACTSLGERFLLDVLAGDDVVGTFSLGRWRGSP